MRVVRTQEGRPQVSSAAIFLGTVETQTFVGEESEHVKLTLVRFGAGARTKLHAHAFEQVLLITEGEGIVATENEQHRVTPGDVVVIPPGEPHTHGGSETSAMAHISITTPGETTLLE